MGVWAGRESSGQIDGRSHFGDESWKRVSRRLDCEGKRERVLLQSKERSRPAEPGLSDAEQSFPSKQAVANVTTRSNMHSAFSAGRGLCGAWVSNHGEDTG